MVWCILFVVCCLLLAVCCCLLCVLIVVACFVVCGLLVVLCYLCIGVPCYRLLVYCLLFVGFCCVLFSRWLRVVSCMLSIDRCVMFVVCCFCWCLVFVAGWGTCCVTIAVCSVVCV